MVGAILNGGSSQRMGTEKSALAFGGATFLERAVETLAAVVDRIMVVGGRDAPDGSSLVPDLVDGRGPMGGLATALRHANGEDVVCLAVDLPLLSATTLSGIARPELLPGQARIARTADRLHPLCGAFAHDLAHVAWARLDADDCSVMAFVRSVPHLTLVDVPVREMTNVNTQSEFDFVLRSEADSTQ